MALVTSDHFGPLLLINLDLDLDRKYESNYVKLVNQRRQKLAVRNLVDKKSFLTS